MYQDISKGIREVYGHRLAFRDFLIRSSRFKGDSGTFQEVLWATHGISWVHGRSTGFQLVLKEFKGAQGDLGRSQGVAGVSKVLQGILNGFRGDVRG